MKTRILVVLSSLVMAFAVRAQNPAAPDQFQNAQQRRALQSQTAAVADDESAPELYPGESSDVGPQSVLRTKPRKTLFEAYADVQYFYTDNLYLTERNKIDTGELVSTIEAALAPTAYELAGGQLSPRLGYRHQWFDFGLDGERFPFSNVRLRDLDFNAQTVFADARWSRDKWTVMLGCDASRLMSTENYNEFYKEIVPTWGVQRLFPLCPLSAFAVGYVGDYRFTDSDMPGARRTKDRTDHAVYANFTVTPCKQMVIQPFYQFRYTRFTQYEMFGEDERNDCLQSFGVSVYLIICPNFNIRGFFGYEMLDSDARFVSDYHKLDAGGGINFTLRF